MSWVSWVKKQLASKRSGNETLLVACLLLVVGIVISQIILYQVRMTGDKVHTALNNRVKATQIQNTWIK